MGLSSNLMAGAKESYHLGALTHRKTDQRRGEQSQGTDPHHTIDNQQCKDWCTGMRTVNTQYQVSSKNIAFGSLFPILLLAMLRC